MEEKVKLAFIPTFWIFQVTNGVWIATFVGCCLVVVVKRFRPIRTSFSGGFHCAEVTVVERLKVK